MMATDELRRMLDERRVEWTANDSEYMKETCWAYMGELTAAFAEYNDGTTRFDCDTWCFTPEQAVEATLGLGTCKLTMNGTNGCFGCSECLENIPPLANYCPNCGKAVKHG